MSLNDIEAIRGNDLSELRVLDVSHYSDINLPSPEKTSIVPCVGFDLDTKWSNRDHAIVWNIPASQAALR